MNLLGNMYIYLNSQKLNITICLVICLLSFLNPLILAPKLFTQPNSDFIYGYYTGALNIKNGNGYTDKEREFITHWPPGYSIFISPFVSSDFKSSVKSITLVTSFLALFWVYLLFKIFKKVIPAIPTFIPLGLAVLWPPMLAIGWPQLTAMLFSTLVALSIYVILLLLNSKNHLKLSILSVSLGVILGFAVLVRTIAIPVFLFLIPILLVGLKNINIEKRIKYVILMVVSFIITISPWLLTYYNLTGHIGFTSAGKLAIMDGLSKFSHLEAGKYLINKSDSWYSLSIIINDCFNCLITYPYSTSILFFQKSISPWYSTASERYESIMFVINIPFLILFCISLIQLLRKSFHSLPIKIISVYVISFWLTSILVLSIFRYMTPIFPFVILIIFYSLFNPNSSAKSPEHNYNSINP
jgi:hypothetical protein